MWAAVVGRRRENDRSTSGLRFVAGKRPPALAELDQSLLRALPIVLALPAEEPALANAATAQLDGSVPPPWPLFDGADVLEVEVWYDGRSTARVLGLEQSPSPQPPSQPPPERLEPLQEPMHKKNLPPLEEPPPPNQEENEPAMDGGPATAATLADEGSATSGTAPKPPVVSEVRYCFTADVGGLPGFEPKQTLEELPATENLAAAVASGHGSTTAKVVVLQ